MTNLALYVPTGAFGTVHNPFGKDTANLGLYRALARHGGFDEVGVLSHGRADPAATAEALFEGWPPLTRLWTESALRTSAAARAGAVLRGLPDVASLAWQRQAVGDRSHSLIGLIHTLAPPAIREQIAGAIIAPLQPWDALICTSPSVEAAARTMLEGTADYLASRFGGAARPVQRPMPRLPLIPLGVDVERLSAQKDRPEARARARAELGVPDEEVLVLWLGRLSPDEKAFPQPMFRAVREARALANAPLHMAMAGWFLDAAGPQLYAEAARAYAPGVPLHIVDGNDPARVADLWAAADVFLSLVDNVQETFGLTPLEAMAAGLPVVASDWDGYRYTVRDGVEGFLVPTLIGPPGAGRLMMDRHTLGMDSYQAYVGAVASHTAVDVGAAAKAIARLVARPGAAPEHGRGRPCPGEEHLRMARSGAAGAGAGGRACRAAGRGAALRLRRARRQPRAGRALRGFRRFRHHGPVARHAPVAAGRRRGGPRRAGPRRDGPPRPLRGHVARRAGRVHRAPRPSR